MKIRLAFICCFFLTILSLEAQQNFVIKEAQLNIQMPNSSWKLDNYEAGLLSQYIFKREPIKDKTGLDIVPAIMVYIDDAKAYKQDITTFSITKQKPIMQNGVIIDKVLTWNDKDYPLSCTNSIFYKCHYVSNEINHILYMIHIITKKNVGVQIYMDITTTVEASYVDEFMQVIKSIKVEK